MDLYYVRRNAVRRMSMSQHEVLYSMSHRSKKDDSTPNAGLSESTEIRTKSPWVVRASLSEVD